MSIISKYVRENACFRSFRFAGGLKFFPNELPRRKRRGIQPEGIQNLYLHPEHRKNFQQVIKQKREIVERHGGTVWMEPGPIKGITFYLSIFKDL